MPESNPDPIENYRKFIQTQRDKIKYPLTPDEWNTLEQNFREGMLRGLVKFTPNADGTGKLDFYAPQKLSKPKQTFVVDNIDQAAYLAGMQSEVNKAKDK